MEKPKGMHAGPAQPLKVSTPKTSGKAAEEKSDAAGQFERRRSGSNPTRNPDGLHGANPVVISGDGDATQPFKPGQKGE
jgi:hypothetical protein